MGKLTYAFAGPLWRHGSGWQFISVPAQMSAEIRRLLQNEEEGWGRLKAVAQIGDTSWKTAIWFDTKQQTYLLPVKKEIREKNKIENGQTVSVSLFL
ncbi:DUF1905 domain-containing protein [Flavobacterium caeni]|uniref:DUF1905 domain-containing protein n=1 Tax=Flavobacterium caeni TaxID=490189 RepID=A0A1G5AR06_9FLAO|nr:DUF1905 domain-containing protein [Flavobacterium caeni]SCX80307.1 protein of unknown function [Flavobacterium caeni]